MNKTIISIITLGIILTNNACKKHSHSDDEIKPIITIVEPKSNDTILLSVDPELHIEFTATDETGLHEMNVYVIGADTLYKKNPVVHDLKVFSFHDHVFLTGISSNNSCKVVIEAEDHGGNKAITEQTIFILP